MASGLLRVVLVIVRRVPLATYRLQFNRCFTFVDARGVVDYLHALGITDCYASSYLAAVPGSMHGYDVADPTRLNAEIGTADEYWAWIRAMRARDMGHVLDVVPNHMGIARSANPWWLDVLENGPSSRYARFFDIEWRPVKQELADKALIPILGDQYGASLERQELALAYERGTFIVRYFEDTLPVAPDTFGSILRVDLEDWLTEHPGEDAEELLSVLTASELLPLRTSREPADIAVRAREKEVVKRRLAGLVERSESVRAHVNRAVARINGVKGDPRSFDLLDDLLDRQSYRLAHWRVASEEINYRRFFDVNQLAALRVEDPAVFDEVHRFALELVREGAATGLRIDHVDGLYSPGDYLRRLQSSIFEDGGEAEASPRFYVVVEKILGPDEQVPDDWPVDGTTGYEFGATINNLFVDRRNERALDDIYRRFVRERVSYPDIVHRAKKEVLHETMSGDINSLGHQLNRFSERNRHYRDFTLYSLISALKELIACFPVYRTYVTATAPIRSADRGYIRDAARCAMSRAANVTALEFDFVQKLLLKGTTITAREECEERARFIGKFQQITSPIAAKAIEDTVFYMYNRLMSLNEVGSNPTQFGLEPAAVHEWLAARAERWPAALSATATHDSKRGEDVRARLNVLSEIPGAWKTAVSHWRSVNRRFRTYRNGTTAPDPNEEYLLYQTLVGAWPFDPGQHSSFVERVCAYMTKALREAKAHTSWLRPNEEHERAVQRFITAILDRGKPNSFLSSFEPFQARVADAGIFNSLAQLLIKITAPGVPDFYQGSELWDLNLVDPDNRRPVDYSKRQALLAAIGASADPGKLVELIEQRRDGRIKMFVTARALAARRAFERIYRNGDYIPIEASGAGRDSVFAFARRAGGDFAITCVPRLVASLSPDGAPPIGSAIWTDTRILLPPSLPSDTTFRNVFTGSEHRAAPDGDGVSVGAATLFAQFPVAMLVPR